MHTIMYQIQNKTDDIMLGLLLANEVDNLYTIIANQYYNMQLQPQDK